MKTRLNAPTFVFKHIDMLSSLMHNYEIELGGFPGGNLKNRLMY